MLYLKQFENWPNYRYVDATPFSRISRRSRTPHFRIDRLPESRTFPLGPPSLACSDAGFDRTFRLNSIRIRHFRIRSRLVLARPLSTEWIRREMVLIEEGTHARSAGYLSDAKDWEFSVSSWIGEYSSYVCTCFFFSSDRTSH